MKVFSTILRIFLLSLTIIYCASVQAQNSTLKDAARQRQKAMDLKNTDLVISFFDTSIIAIYHSNPTVYGKERNLKTWQHQFDDSLDEQAITIEKLEVSASGGYELCAW